MAITPMDAASLRFIASLVNSAKGERISRGEHPSWFHQRTHFDITPDVLPDEELRHVFAAIERGAKENTAFMFTPAEIAVQMAELGFIQADSTGNLAGAIRDCATRIGSMADSGAMNKQEFLRLEGLIIEVLRDAKASGVMRELERIWQTHPAAAPLQKIELLADYLNGLRGSFVAQTRTAGVEGQKAILKQMGEDQKAKIGTLDESFPRHFGVLSVSVKPRRKELVVISGPSGGGKSILIHLTAEWWARVLHKRVLFLLTEDSIETTLLRAAARHIPYTTFKELDEADETGKKDKYAEMITEWAAQGGEIVYKEVGGMTPMAIRALIDDEVTQARLQNQPYDMICMDYFQDADFDTEAEQIKSTRVAVAARFAIHLRAIATKYDVVMVVASQETVDGEEVKTAWSKRLTEKAQVWIRFQTVNAPEDITVLIGSKPMYVAQAGEAVPFMYVSLAKGNRGRQGQRTILYRLGVAQAAYELGFYQQVRRNPDMEWQPIVFEKPGPEFFQRQHTAFVVADATVDQLGFAPTIGGIRTDKMSKAQELDPVRRKGKASGGGSKYIPG